MFTIKTEYTRSFQITSSHHLTLYYTYSHCFMRCHIACFLAFRLSCLSLKWSNCLILVSKNHVAKLQIFSNLRQNGWAADNKKAKFSFADKAPTAKTWQPSSEQMPKVNLLSGFREGQEMLTSGFRFQGVHASNFPNLLWTLEIGHFTTLDQFLWTSEIVLLDLANVATSAGCPHSATSMVYGNSKIYSKQMDL